MGSYCRKRLVKDGTPTYTTNRTQGGCPSFSCNYGALWDKGGRMLRERGRERERQRQRGTERGREVFAEGRRKRAWMVGRV